jgi:hypothetical protein
MKHACEYSIANAAGSTISDVSQICKNLHEERLPKGNSLPTLNVSDVMDLYERKVIKKTSKDPF